MLRGRHEPQLLAQSRVHVGFRDDRDEVANTRCGKRCELGFDLGPDLTGISAGAEPNLKRPHHGVDLPRP